MAVEISNPAELPDPTGFGYSHVARVRGELVFIAGQYDSDAEGNPTGTDFAVQVDNAFSNLGIALRSVGLDFADVAQLRTHIVDHDLDKLAVLGKKIAALWGDRPPAQTLTGVAALALPGMLFEVDAVAVRD
ncbi:Rid family hydrolase [Nocardia sp. NBC_00881]|uniref:RidA family protein n=1 Tax=Nocardia sp. NBC_00881 TaxID=2975995 RepID=UPI003867DC3E|nr:Rid family hydrolase [Nocardia sp. NBC_00881]